LTVGSSAALRVLYRGEPPEQLPPELWCYRADEERVIIGGALSDGGNLYSWLRASFLQSEDDELIEKSLELFEPDAHGLTVLPFWSGERSIGWSLNARGSIIGLTSNTRPIEILRAAMEAVAYRLALIAEALAPFAPGANIIASGNALRCSPTWMQIITDVLGAPITLTQQRGPSILGAALLALEATGKIETLETRNVAVGTTFEPDMNRHARYRKAVERQQKFYKQLIET
jgi:gluconokinase